MPCDICGLSHETGQRILHCWISPESSAISSCPSRPKCCAEKRSSAAGQPRSGVRRSRAGWPALARHATHPRHHTCCRASRRWTAPTRRIVLIRRCSSDQSLANQTERVDHLAAALRYASQGVPVFPLAPRSKFPLISAANDGHGLHDATTDAARIQAWWMAHPTANIGLRTSISFDVIDLDTEAAVDALEQARAGREPLRGPVVQTGHGFPLVREAHWGGESCRRSGRNRFPGPRGPCTRATFCPSRGSLIPLDQPPTRRARTRAGLAHSAPCPRTWSGAAQNCA
jgi:Bifunctional DNA primase/polymerase, N-terminal